jgi:polar amino acid transport system substrate-binding protein
MRGRSSNNTIIVRARQKAYYLDMARLSQTMLPLMALLACASVQAAQEEMVFIAPTNHGMPLAQFKDGRINNGILMELGVAIAHKLGRTARFVSVPSKRVAMVLSKGEADGVCYVLPHWIDGDFRWSRPLIPNGMLLIAHPGAPVVRSVAELAGRKIGTVAGYRYPQIEEVLGGQFIRDDAPTSEHTVSKLAAGRTSYAIVGQSMFEYLRRYDKNFHARPEFLITTVTTQCAFSRQSKIPFAQVDKAINALVEQGGVDEILSHYR